MLGDLDQNIVRFELEARRREAALYRLGHPRRIGGRAPADGVEGGRRLAWFTIIPALTAGRSHRALTISLCVAVGILLVVSAGAGTLRARELYLGPFALAPHQWYLWQDSTQADLLSVTVDGSSISGTLADTELRDTKVRTDRWPITGTVSGGRVMLQLDTNLFGSVRHPQAVYRDSAFILQVSKPGGAQLSLTFTPSTNAKYEAVVQQFRHTAKANAEAAAALARADRQIDQAALTFNAAYTTVQNDATNLPDDQHLGDAAQAANQAGAGLLSAANDKQKVVNEGPSASSCSSDARTVGYDAGSLQSYQGSVSTDAQALQGDVTTTVKDVTALQNAQNAYQQAESGDPAHPAQVPSASQVITVTLGLQAAQGQTQQSMTTYASWVAQDYSLAQTLAQQAQSVCG